MEAGTTRPYLIRAIYDWANDNAFTPFLLVDARGEGVVVPEQFVEDNSIVLNIAPSAVKDLHICDEFISFSARFAGKAQELFVPVQNVRAIYAKENGEGLVLPEDSTPKTLVDGAVGSDEKPSTAITGHSEKASPVASVKIQEVTDGHSDKPTPAPAAEDSPGNAAEDVPKKAPPKLTIVD